MSTINLIERFHMQRRSAHYNSGLIMHAKGAIHAAYMLATSPFVGMCALICFFAGHEPGESALTIIHAHAAPN